MRSVVSHTLLVVFSVMFCFVFAEGLTRIAIFFHSPSSLSLHKQLEQSRLSDPVAIEGTTTVAGLIQPSTFPDVVYELKPNIRATFQGKPLSTNSAGMRDREYSLEKPPGAFRVVGIGDSVMFGWGVDVADTYLEVVEQILKQRLTGGAEVLNAAVPGYNTAMEVALFERKLQYFDPDLLVLHFVGNDFTVPLFMTRPLSRKGLTHSYFFDFVQRRFSAVFPRDTPANELLGVRDPLEQSEKQNVRSHYRYMLGQKGFRRAMSKLAALTKLKNIPVVVITGSKRKSVGALSTKLGFFYASVSPFVENFVASNMPGAEADARRAALWVSPHDSHPNRLGHKLYADTLMDVLNRQNLIPLTN